MTIGCNWGISTSQIFPRSSLGASFESTSEKLKDLQAGEVLEMLEGPRKASTLMGWESTGGERRWC